MSELEGIIKQRIREQGRITFAEFMEMALYFPELGYYTSSKRTVGADGDFFTSPVTHPVFAAFISIQLEQIWGSMGYPSPFTIVEMGAGQDLLAHNILAYIPNLAQGFSESIAYIAAEKDNISVLQGDPEYASEWPGSGVKGCVLSNELLDAFPVHRVKMIAGKLYEVYVALDGDELIETLDEPSTPMLEKQLSNEGVTLSDGYKTEINLNIDKWMDGVACILESGYLLTIDYGYPAKYLYAPERCHGTLMTYYKHTHGNDPFRFIGHQDITAHVDFTNVILSGERKGFEFAAFATQQEFCFNLGLNYFLKSLERQGLKYSEYMANRFSMLELVRHEGMGGFGVLAQSKGLPQIKLSGCNGDNEEKKELHAQRELPVPLLAPEHLPLLRSKYPHLMDFDTGLFQLE